MKPILEVEWEDHYSTEEWIDKDDPSVDETYIITTVGYFLKETKTKLVLVQNIASNGKVACTMTIIKKNIKSRKIIKEAQ